MTPDKFIDALRTNEAVVIFPNKKSLNKALKYLEFDKYCDYLAPNTYCSYKGIPLRAKSKE